MSEFANSLLNRLNYHKSMNSSENALKNLQHINPKLNESSIFALANLCCNPAFTEDERNIFMECVRAKAITEYEIYSKEVNKILQERERESSSLS